jgi:hypothetical protein
MLGETRASCFEGWMREQAAQDITKARWVLVFKESNALWHAVVLAFRQMYEELERDETGRWIGLYEEAQDSNGNPIPTHHISDLQILCTWGQARRDVARGRWRTFIRKEFAENTAHFVREYQRLLMGRYNDIKAQLFGFWFYPSDLCRWVKDLQAEATLTESATDAREARRDINAPKRFKWPACCKKGENLDDPIISTAYKTFCTRNQLWQDDRRSRLQFCMRMRAAWLRVVACYPYAPGKPAPTEAQIETYLEEQHVYEISLLKNKNGASDWKVEPRHVLLWPERFNFERLRKEDVRDRRVLVYGAPMRANPYLCGPCLDYSQ